MAISSSSTLADVRAQYEDNCDYQDSASVTKARLFANACRFLILRLPQTVTHGNQAGTETIGMDLLRIENQLADAQAFIMANATSTEGGRVFTFKDFREQS
jgi:hypothetical protein